MPRPVKYGLAAAGVIGIAAILSGCRGPSTPQSNTCECPNGTEHPHGTEMPCCDGDDCDCTIAPPPPAQQQPKECECPDGTVHPYGTPMPCCDGEDCTCTVAPPPPPKECECTEKDHAAPCNCGADAGLCNCTVKANPKVYTLYLDNLVSDMLGEHPIKIEDKTWEVTQTHLDSIQTVLSIMNTAAKEGEGPYDVIVPGVKERDNVKIIVEEGNDFTYDAAYNYRVVDGRSIAVNIAWLSGAKTNKIGSMLSQGFGNMLLTPLARGNIFDSKPIYLADTNTIVIPKQLGAGDGDKPVKHTSRGANPWIEAQKINNKNVAGIVSPRRSNVRLG